jgi:hypothetical protein
MVDMQPEIDEDGTKWWYVDDWLHRTDGPAIEWPDGDVQWWWCGNYVRFDVWLKKNDTLSEEEKVMFKLEHG